MIVKSRTGYGQKRMGEVRDIYKKAEQRRDSYWQSFDRAERATYMDQGTYKVRGTKTG